MYDCTPSGDMGRDVKSVEMMQSSSGKIWVECIGTEWIDGDEVETSWKFQTVS